MEKLPKSASDINVSVFTETPHGDMSTRQAVETIKRNQNTDFRKATTLHGINWHGKTIVEAGCGAGFVLLPRALRGAKVIGIDGSAVQIERIKKHAAALNIFDGTFILGRLEDFHEIAAQFRISEVDLVMCSGVIHHVTGWKDLIAQLSKITKPGGYLYLSWVDYTIHLSGWNIKNQIAHGLGWNSHSRREIGKLLFGWWDKRRNKMKIEWNSFFADLYAAYYIPISYRRMKKELENNGFEILQALPPHTVDQWVAMHERTFGEDAHDNKRVGVVKTLIKYGRFAKIFLGFLVRSRYYLLPGNGVRVVSCVRKR